MITRKLEKKNYLRVSVDYAEIIELQEFGVLLKTFAIAKKKVNISSADSQMLEQQKLISDGDRIEGTIQIDVCAEDVIRVRYGQGKCVKENITPMLVGSFLKPKTCILNHPQDSDGDDLGKVFITTDKIELTIHLKPYSIEMKNLISKDKVTVGGSEKDYFINWDSINTGMCYEPGNNISIAAENFSLQHDECIYGFGEKFIKLNKVGQTIDLNMEDGLGVTTPRSYKNIPFYISTKGYGVFFNHSSLMTFWVGSMSACDIQVAIEDDFLDYFIFSGSIKEIQKNYTTLTGKGSVPPKWTFGYWQSKISYSSAEETLEIAKKMREHQIPCDVIHLDTHWFKKDWYCDLEFSKDRFPDPEAYMKTLLEMGIKISLWQLPYIPEGSELFEDIKAVDGFVKDTNGNIYNNGVCFVEDFKGIVGVIDYTNPKAIEIHKNAFRRLFRMGVKVIKTDFGEAAPLDGVYHDGTLGHRMHNLYPLIYNKALFEVTKEETGEGVVWARSAWAGSQRYPLHWGGDNSPNYMNMAPQLAGGLSLGLSGFQFWSQDIGGFCGETNDQLLIRWMQAGMFLSHARIHGSGDRELYKFAPETIRICKNYIQLRYKLMPYIYGSSMKCVEESLPVARALVIEYQEDPNVWNISDQYLFGDFIMVAPIFNEESERKVYLPKGIWTDWWTGERIKGKQWIEVETDIEILPLYIREGAIIPMGPVMNYVDEIRTESIDLLISLYENENSSSFNIPVNDTFIPVNYEFINGKHLVKIGKTDVKFNIKVFGESMITTEYI
ncbi:MAG TPA: TIM-barrel domain-containing protein [Ruminiclostridium sp.]